MVLTVPAVASNLMEVWELFSINVPQGWIYQIQESNDNLIVFYGPSDYELIYIELLGSVSDKSATDFANRVIENYNDSKNGLKDFFLKKPFRNYKLDGVPVVEAIYHYEGRIERTEKRLFILFKDQGLSVTYSNVKDYCIDNQDGLQNFLANWRWLVIE